MASENADKIDLLRIENENDEDLEDTEMEDNMLKSMFKENKITNLNEKDVSSNSTLENNNEQCSAMSSSEDEGEEDNDLYTSNEEISSIKCGTWSSEVTGFVQTIIGPRTCGNNGQYRKMVFTINNNKGSILHVTVWKEEIPRIESSLILNSVVRISGAEINAIRPGDQNKGNQNIQLTIRKNTLVTCLQAERQMNKIVEEEIRVVDFENLKNEKGHIILEGYLKSTIRLLKYHMRDELIHYGVGSVTNGKYKIEVRVKNFPDDVDEFKKGDHVRVDRVLKFTRMEKIIYLELNSTKDILILDDRKMSFEDIFAGYQVIQKEEK